MREWLIAGLALAALGTSPALAETRALSGFTGVAAEDNLRVEVSLAPRHAVEVVGADAARVRTEVRDGVLHIRRTNRPWWGGNPPMDATIRVTLLALQDLAAARGANVSATNIVAQDVELAAAMGGEITISGTCRNLEAAAAMGGVLHADRFECVGAEVSAAMGGDARVYASTSFDASAAMGGNINIAGDGRGDISTAMGGTVNR